MAQDSGLSPLLAAIVISASAAKHLMKRVACFTKDLGQRNRLRFLIVAILAPQKQRVFLITHMTRLLDAVMSIAMFHAIKRGACVVMTAAARRMSRDAIALDCSDNTQVPEHLGEEHFWLAELATQYANIAAA